MDMKERFTYVYDNNVWGGSGGGSDPAYLGEYFKWLNQFIKDKGIERVIDYGCGLEGGKNVHAPIYVGYDVVESVIEHCKKNYAGKNRYYYLEEDLTVHTSFQLIIIKDVLMHWSYDEIERCLDFFKGFYKYIVLVNSCQQTEDYQKCSETPHLYATPLSHKFLPLAEYSPELIMTLNANQNDPKEVLLITNNNL